MLNRRPLDFACWMLALLLVASSSSRAQPTMGLLQNDPGTFDGYTMFESLASPGTYLINNDGLVVHSWSDGWYVAATGYLLENGHLIRGISDGTTTFNVPGGGGRVREHDWDGNLVWDFNYSSATVRHHHDIEPLPNGNVLLVAWELKTRAEAIQAGRDSTMILDNEIYPEHVVEVEPVGANGGNIVWEWHVWDHLVQDYDAGKDNFGVVADHPELVNINFMETGGKDWLHANSVAYNADLDQIVLSINQFREFWIIDHGTTTAEAAGHTGGARGKGGDLLYRWGNPQAYDRGTGFDQMLFREHNVHWIGSGLTGSGDILLFNNGMGRPAGSYSSVDEIPTTVDANGDYPTPAAGVPHGPAAPSWVYTTTPPTDMYSAIISGAQRLPNGNTLICEGSPTGTFREVDPAGTTIWMYVNPVGPAGPMEQGADPTGNRTFRALRYAPSYAAFTGRDLTPGAPVETYLTSVAELERRSGLTLRQNFPNPVAPATTISFSLHRPGTAHLDVYSVSGRRVETLVSAHLAVGEHRYRWQARDLANGVYFYRLRVGAEAVTRKMIVAR